MNLFNSTNLPAGYITTTDKTGRESIVVVIKGTYGIPDEAHLPSELLSEQVPLVTTDVFGGEPGFSAPLYEIDLGPQKPRCDVLLNGSCYAPGGEPTAHVEVSMQIGSLKKSFRVVGPRHFKGKLSCSSGDPQPFTVLPISYNNAYGGIDKTNPDPAKHCWYELNHAGVGYHPMAPNKELHGKPLPNTEELGNAVDSPDGSFKPMALGPLGRSWRQRIRWAGSFDQKWLDEQFPFLPEDFDTKYFHSAPEDQQIDHPRGDEEVTLKNLTRQGLTSFRLPTDLGLAVVFFCRDVGMTEVSAKVDTVFLEPDLRRFMLTWKASLPLRRNIREVNQVKIGQTASQIYREQRRRGKRVGSLAQNVRWLRNLGTPSRQDGDSR